jgi:hypothetical protein
MNIIFDVKQEFRREARLDAGGHLVDATYYNIYSSTVKWISVKVVHVIAHKQKLKQSFSDVGNSYINAFIKETVFIVAGPENDDK